MERTPSGFANALEIFHQCSITAADADPTSGARNASFMIELVCFPVANTVVQSGRCKKVEVARCRSYQINP